jgi:DNA-binding response OmpR family regulator
VARVLALVPDLLFGSQVQGMLRAAGHDVDLVAGPEAARDRVHDADLLIVDLTAGTEGADLLESMRAGGGLGSARALAFYSHVEGHTRERAEQAGFDMVVPRSRMAREGAQLVARLVAGQAEGSAG